MTHGSAPSRVAVLGPTASGKSSVAMAVARELGDVDLISVDSMQVYRGMDIGTAKPTLKDQAAVPHHLIDLVEPNTEFGVSDFQTEYRRVLSDLAAAGHRGLLVGGTGLYHRAAIDGLDLPGEWPEIRDRLGREASEGGPEELYARLSSIDPLAASRMEPTNTRRIVRALEVCEGSGQLFSSFGPGLQKYPESGVVQIGLRWDRKVLTDRIEQRVHSMIDDGFLDEVSRLLEQGLSKTAGQALGYRELGAHLAGDVGLDEAIENTITHTRQFAVRQLRWFQRDPRVRWVDIEHDPVAEAAPIVRSAFQT